MKKNKNNNDLFKNGFTIIKKAIDKNNCKTLVKYIINNILHKYNIYTSKSKKKIITINDNYGKPLKKLNKWKPLFESVKFRNFINNYFKKTKSNINKIKCLNSNGLGWIHVRIPYNTRYYNKNRYWHIDSNNIKNQPNYIDPNYSLIFLPFLTTVKKDGGGTIVIPKSHKLIKKWNNSKNKKNLQNYINKIANTSTNKEIIGEQGDILVMDSNLIHSLSLPDKNKQVRIVFNLSI